MSGNPFRRSVLKGPATASLHSDPSDPSDPVVPSATIPIPLSVDTRAKTVSQTTKHVAFRSPPALPLSPDSPALSYPPSPISARISTGLGVSVGSPVQNTVFDETYAVDPFDSDPSDESGDGGLRQARQNAQTNLAWSVQGATTITTTTSTLVSHDPVQTALTKFPSIQRSTLEGQGQGQGQGQEQIANKDGPRETLSRQQTMDVDAFTRMLLTGANVSQGSSTSKESPSQGGPPLIPSTSESSSSADTASISRQSIFEPLPPIPADSPRTSQELDEDEADDERQLVEGKGGTAEAKRRPLPPKPRYGKLVKHNMPMGIQAPPMREVQNERPAVTSPALALTATRSRDNSDLNKPLPPPPVDTVFPDITNENRERDSKTTDPPRRPPTPPLARRRSNRQSAKPILSRSSSSLQHFPEIEPSPPPPPPSYSSSPTFGITKAQAPPPPPPTRRSDRRPSMASIEQEPNDLHDLASSPFLPMKPPPPPARTLSSPITKQLSAQQQIPPPLPPPRRARGTSKSSFELLSMTPMSTGANGGESTAESSRNVSGASNASDILANLAALQREVDAIRARAGNG